MAVGVTPECDKLCSGVVERLRLGVRSDLDNDEVGFADAERVPRDCDAVPVILCATEGDTERDGVGGERERDSVGALSDRDTVLEAERGCDGEALTLRSFEKERLVDEIEPVTVLDGLLVPDTVGFVEDTVMLGLGDGGERLPVRLFSLDWVALGETLPLKDNVPDAVLDHDIVGESRVGDGREAVDVRSIDAVFEVDTETLRDPEISTVSE